MRRTLAAGMAALLALALAGPPASAGDALPPANDDLDQATALAYPFSTAHVDVSVDNTAATAEDGEPHPCGGSERTAWYKIQVPSDAPFGVLLVEDNGSTLQNLRVAAGRVQDGAFSVLGCGGGTWATTQLSRGATAYIQVMDDGSGGGILRLRFSILPAPPNDSVYAPYTVTAAREVTSVDNRAALRDGWPPAGAPEPTPCGSSRTVWYRFTAPRDGQLTVTPDMTLLPDPALQLWVLTGTSVSSLVPGTCATWGSLVFEVRQGVTYYVQAADVAQSDVTLETRGGTLRLIFEFEAAPDRTPPMLWLPGSLEVEATGPAGSPVSFDPFAWDAVDGAVAVACEPASGSTFPLGATTVACRAGDAAGNTSSGSFDVTVVDTTAPVVAFGDHPSTYLVSDIVTITCTAIDAVGVETTTCADLNRAAWTFGIGTHTLTATAADAAGNSATTTTVFTVEVSYEALMSLTSEWVWKAQIATELNAYLDAADRASQRDKDKAVTGLLGSYRKLLSAQAGKAVSDADARTLILLSFEL